MFSCLRSSVPGIPRKIRATTNPYGPCHNEIMQRFKIAERKPNEVLGPLIDDERDSEGRVMPTRRAIFGHINENKLLNKVDPQYLSRMIPAHASEALKKAWRDGDWNITAGGIVGDIWATHQQYIVVPKFDPPTSWAITRAYDHGSAKPFCCLWFAKSDGSELIFPADAKGECKRMQTKRGDLFIVGELYGSTGHRDEGLQLPPDEIVKRIIQYELDRGWRTPDGSRCRVKRGPADTGIWVESDGRPSIAQDMEARVMLHGTSFRGIIWEPADKKAGSRKQGWEQLRKWLAHTKPDENTNYREFPGLFVCTNCEDWIRTVPWLQRDEKDMDDVPENAEDHCFAAGTLVDLPGCQAPIDKLPGEGIVHSKDRLERYQNPRKTRRSKLVLVSFSDGRKLRCSPDHGFLVGPDQFCYASALKGKRVQCSQSLLAERFKSSTVFATICAVDTFSEKAFAFTYACGNIIKDWYQRVTTSITNTVGIATAFGTSNACPQLSISNFMDLSSASEAGNTLSAKGQPSLLDGIDGLHRHLRVRDGIKRMGSTRHGLWLYVRKLGAFASYATSRSWSLTGSRIGQNFVALFAKDVTCVGVEELPGLHDVYCLTVPANGVFSIEGGLLVSNCAEATRFRLRYLDMTFSTRRAG